MTDYKDVIVSFGKYIDTIQGQISENDYGSFFKINDQNAVGTGFLINNQKIMRTNTLHVQFYYENDGNYTLFDKRDIYTMPLRNWAGFYCRFGKAGNYKFMAYNDENILVTKHKFQLPENSFATHAIVSSSKGVYAGISIDKNSGVLSGESSSFQKNSTVVFKISNGGYKFGIGQFKATFLVGQTQKSIPATYFETGPDATVTSFKWTFNEAGTYTIAVSFISKEFGIESSTSIGSVQITIY